MNDQILTSVENGILTVTLNRPQSRNALTFEMYDRLAEISRVDAADEAVRVLVITGAGEKAFAAGTDISQFREFQTEADAIAYEDRIERTLTALEECPVPTIAAISGACTGGGAGIAAACDLRIAAANARFGFPIARTLGNCLSLVNYGRLAALIGAGRVMDVILTARLVGADEAIQIGLISEVLDDHATLMSRAAELAETLSGHAPLTMRVTREAIRRLRQGRQDDHDLISKCYMSEDFKEGLEAFFEKRPAQWKGR